MLTQLRRVVREVTREDMALVACKALDAYSDWLVLGNVVFFLAEVLAVGDLVTGVARGALDFAVRVYVAVHAGRVQDEWPRGRMFALTTVTKIVAAVATWVAVAAAVLVRDRAVATLVVAIVLAVLVGASEAYSSLVYLNAVTFVNERRRSTAVDRLLYAIVYAVGNLAAALAWLTMVAVREATARADLPFARADVLLMLMGATAMAASAVVASLVDRHFAALPAAPAPAPTAGKAVGADGSFSWRLLGRYALFVATMLGVEFVYEQLGALLPKFLVRQYGLATLYPAFQAINPLLIFLLAPTLCLATGHWPLMPMLAAGTGATALAAAAMGLSTTSPWVVAAALVVITVGEAIGMAQTDTYVTTHVMPANRIGRYQGIAAVPRGLIALGSNAASGLLLDAFCPATAGGGGGVGTGCAAPGTLWLVVGGIGGLTPLLVGLQMAWARMGKR